MMEVIKNISSVVGCIAGCLALLATVSKPFRQAAINFVAKTAKTSETEMLLKEFKEELKEFKKGLAEEREYTRSERKVISDEIATLNHKMDVMQQQSDQNDKALQDKVNTIIEDNKVHDHALQSIMRDRIVSTYYANLGTKQLHYEEWVAVNSLAEDYFKCHGNGFVHGMIEQMNEWDIVQ